MVLLFNLNCSKDLSDDVPSSYTTLSGEIEAGWLDYTEGNYDAAREHFITAAERDAASISAYNGIGWTDAKNGNFTSAKAQFSFVNNLALIQDDSLMVIESNAGYCAAYFLEYLRLENMNDIDDATREDLLLNAIKYADLVLATGHNYSSEHDALFDLEGIQKLKVNAYYILHRFEDAMDAGNGLYDDLLSEITVLEDSLDIYLRGDDGVINAEFYDLGTTKSTRITTRVSGIFEIDKLTSKTKVVYDPTGISSVEVDDLNLGDFVYHLKNDDKLIFESAENFDYPTFRDTITASIHISFISSINGEKVLYIKHPGVFYVPKCYLITDPFENNVAFSVWHPSKDNIIPDKEWTFDLIRLVGGTVGAQYVVEYSARAYQVNYKRTDELDVLLKNITNVFNN